MQKNLSHTTFFFHQFFKTFDKLKAPHHQVYEKEERSKHHGRVCIKIGERMTERIILNFKIEKSRNFNTASHKKGTTSRVANSKFGFFCYWVMGPYE